MAKLCHIHSKDRERQMLKINSTNVMTVERYNEKEVIFMTSKRN